MKSVKLGTILENAARMAGRQVALMGVPDNWRALAALAVRDGVRRIAAEKFPVMRRTEFRRYRPTWTSNDGWVRGQECWHEGDYYRLDADYGTAVPSSGGGWTKLEMKDLCAFIDFEQPWELVSIDRQSVDVNRFAFVADPRQNPDATPVSIARMTELGVVMKSPAPKGVFIQFTPVFPNVSFVEWSNESGYESGDVVYLTSTKECYEAYNDVEVGGLSPASDTANWQPVRISADFEPFLTRLAAVDMLTEDQGKFQTKASAEAEFESLCERLHEGTGEVSVRRGRFI